MISLRKRVRVIYSRISLLTSLQVPVACCVFAICTTFIAFLFFNSWPANSIAYVTSDLNTKKIQKKKIPVFPHRTGFFVFVFFGTGIVHSIHYTIFSSCPYVLIFYFLFLFFTASGTYCQIKDDTLFKVEQVKDKLFSILGSSLRS